MRDGDVVPDGTPVLTENKMSLLMMLSVLQWYELVA